MATMMRIVFVVTALILANSPAGSGSCVAAKDSDTVSPAQIIELPVPRLEGEMSVEEALSARRSVRSFSDAALSLEEVSQLLWAAQGITYPKRGFRTAPSAGALYPLETYVVAAQVDGLAPGIYKYSPHGHSLSLAAAGDKRGDIFTAAYQQAAITDAPALICFSALYSRTSVKYGAKAMRYVPMDAGHAAQNVLLQAVALGLSCVPIGGFEDGKVKVALGLPGEEEPLYVIPVGRP